MQLFDNDSIQRCPKHTLKCGKYQAGKQYSVKIEEIAENPFPSRSQFTGDQIEVLANSVRKSGILQPIVCTIAEDGGLQLAAGERRQRAAILAGHSKIPCWVVKGDPAEISLIENLLRQGLSTVQEAEAVYNLKTRKAYKLEDLASLLDKAVSTVSEIIAVSSLPLVIRNDCRSNMTIPRDVLVHISRLPSDCEKIECYEKFKTGEMSRNDMMSVKRHSVTTIPLFPASKLISNFSIRFQKIDFESMVPEECDSYRPELEELQKKIGDTLKILNRNR